MILRKRYIKNHLTPIGIIKNFILNGINIPDELKDYIGEYLFSKKFCNYNYDINIHYELLASYNNIGTTIYLKTQIPHDKFIVNFIHYVLLQHFHIKKNNVVIPQYKQHVNYLVSDNPVYYYIIEQFIYYNKFVYYALLEIIHKYIYNSNSFIVSMINDTHEMNYELRYILNNYQLKYPMY